MPSESVPRNTSTQFSKPFLHSSPFGNYAKRGLVDMLPFCGFSAAHDFTFPVFYDF